VNRRSRLSEKEFVGGVRESPGENSGLTGIHDSGRRVREWQLDGRSMALGKAFCAKYRNGRIEPRNPLGFREGAELIVTAEEVEARSADAPEDIWAGYYPNAVDEALRATAGSWVDIDPDALVAAIYRARGEGTRPPSGS